MTSEKQSPADALLTTDWAAAFLDSPDFAKLWMHFRGLTPEGAEDQGAARALRLLSEVCSYWYSGDDINDPYGPAMHMGDRRTAAPIDLSQADLIILFDILPHVPYPPLAARIADVLWLKRYGPNPYEHATEAVRHWSDLFPVERSLKSGLLQNWPRFIDLALRHNMRPALSVMRKGLHSVFMNASGKVALDSLRLRLSLGSLEVEERRAMAKRMQALGSEEESPVFKRQMIRMAVHLYEGVDDKDSAAECRAAIVRSWVSEAEERSKGSLAVANSLYESALQDFREMPRAQRLRLNLSALEEELPRRISESGQAALDEMMVITSDPIDISDSMEMSRRAVGGKTAIEALRAFVALAAPMSPREEEETARAIMVESPFASLFGETHYSSQGRVVYKTNPGEAGPWGYEAALWSGMVRQFDIKVRLIVQGVVMPTLELLVNEHPLTLMDFHVIVEGSGIVPGDRKMTIAKALYAGYNYDFLQAVYIEAPQIEHLVRNAMQASGLRTTTINGDGIEQELGLSALLQREEVVRIFGENLVFELRALFAGPVGPNLRNEVAHGLLSDAHGQSIHVVYAWWFLLRLVFSPYWNRLQKQEAEKDSGGTVN